MSENSEVPCGVDPILLKRENARLRDILRIVLASAHPHPVEHGALYAAFEQVREVLKTAPPE